MDKQDEEFEAFLRKFTLRAVAPPPMPAAIRSRARLWVPAAVVAMAALLVASVWIVPRKEGVRPSPSGEVGVRTGHEISGADPLHSDEDLLPPRNESQSKSSAARAKSEPPKTTATTKPSPPAAEPELSAAVVVSQQRDGAGEKSPPAEQTRDAGVDGPGKQIFERACSSCHRTEFMNNRTGLSKEEYSAFVARKRGSGTTVSDAEVPVLVDYLFAVYGGRPPIRYK